MLDIKLMRDKVKNLSILIVDDEEKIRNGTSVFMKKFFKNVDIAENGETALEMFKNKQYDVLLTDVQMPILNGWDLIKSIKDLDSHIFIAVMTGSPDDYSITKDTLDIYMSKPIGVKDMKKLLQTIIEKKAL